MPHDLDDDRIALTMTWALANLREELTVETLARRAHMSARTFLRHFARCTGTSPARWLIAQRIQASLLLLEKTSAPIEEIARTVGFASPVTYRSHFVRAMQTIPSRFRRRTQRRSTGRRSHRGPSHRPAGTRLAALFVRCSISRSPGPSWISAIRPLRARVAVLPGRGPPWCGAEASASPARTGRV